MTAWRHWTPAEDETLRQLNAQGMSDRRVAETFGCRWWHVRDRRKILKITAAHPHAKGPWTEKDDELLRELWWQGLFDEDIGKQLGRHKSSVGLRRRALGLKAQRRVSRKPVKAPKRRPWTERDTEILRDLNAHGWSMGDIGYIMGRPRRTIQDRLYKMGMRGQGKPGARGWRHSEEARIKISEQNKRRWDDPAYRERMASVTAKASEVLAAKRYRRPPKGTPEFKLYIKIANALGAEAARKTICPDGWRSHHNIHGHNQDATL